MTMRKLRVSCEGVAQRVVGKVLHYSSQLSTSRFHVVQLKDNGPAEEDDEENEQERLAKRFAKRARMHRLLELHGEEEEFSRSRLIDEDETIRQELSNMKVSGMLRRLTTCALRYHTSHFN